MLGLVLSPYGYIALGALSAFAPAFSLLALPLLLTSSMFLLVRFVWHRTWQRPGKLLLLAEGASWLLTGAFLIIISGFTLQTGFERTGLYCTLFLACSLLCLPLVLLRKTAVRDRLAGVSDGLVLPLALLFVLVPASFMAMFLARPATFL